MSSIPIFGKSLGKTGKFAFGLPEEEDPATRASKEAREARRKRLAQETQRTGRRATILTSQTGTTGDPAVAKPRLLGE